MFGTIAAHLQRIGVPAAGPRLARFHDRGDSVEVEAGYLVGERVTRHDEVGPSELPDGPVAATWHRGDPHAIDGAIDALQAWCEQKGVEPSGAVWAVFHVDPSQVPDPRRR